MMKLIGSGYAMKSCGWSVVAFLVAVTIGGCAMVTEVSQDIATSPGVRVSDFRFTPTSLVDGQGELVLVVSNPNPIGVKVNAVSYQLALGEQGDVVTGSQSSGLRIPAAGEAKLSIPIDVAFGKALDSVLDLASRRHLAYQLTGDVGIGPLRLPYAKEGQLDLPKLPDIRLVGIEVKSVGLVQTVLELTFRLDNPNEFVLLMDRLEYRLTLDEKQVGTGRLEFSNPVTGKASDEFLGKVEISSLQAGQAVLNVLRQDRAAYRVAGILYTKTPTGQALRPFTFDLAGEVPLQR